MSDKIIINAIISFLRVVLSPASWLQNHYYSKAWDAELNQLMRNERFVSDDSPYYAKIGDKRVWIANHPYASFVIVRDNQAYRPKRITILRAMSKLKKDREYELRESFKKTYFIKR